MMDPQSGRISHYRVLGELGRDRLGYVLRAADEQLDRAVVLRVLRAAAVFPPEQVAAVRAAFKREAKRAAAVSHPGLVTVFAFEALADTDLIAMELVDGVSLRAMLALGDRWRIPEAAKLIAVVADAVAAAHAARLDHGRLTLANVVLRPDGRVKVLDLGMPKLAETGVADSGLDAAAAERVIRRAVDRQADVRALGLLTWELAISAHRPPGALWRPVHLATQEIDAVLGDPIAARARFGILGPVLARALAPPDGAVFRDAAQFRDAVLAALNERVRRTSAPAEPPAALGEATRILMPDHPSAASGVPFLEADVDALSAGAAARAPRLVLPADLAEGAAPVPGEGYVVMTSDGLGSRLRAGLTNRWSSRIESVGAGPSILAALVLVLVAGGLLAAQRYFENGEGSSAMLAQRAPTAAQTAGAVASDGGIDPTGMSADTSANDVAPDAPRDTAVENAATDTVPGVQTAVSPPAPSSAVLMSAVVRGTPAGTTIRVVGQPDSWTDVTELTVPAGDSVLVQFSRPGYVARTAVFKGSRLAVALQPDSVSVRLESNVPAQVFLLGQGNPRPLGTTNLTVRLPTGSHRILFRAPEQSDWVTTQGFARAGESYRVSKTDFVTEGSLVATVIGTWAWVSVDGGPDRETPVRFDRLPIGQHTIRVSREGYVTITDTVTIRPGQVVTRQYTLQPVS